MIETEVDPDRRIAIHRGHGTLLLAELPAVTRRLAADPTFDPDYAIVWDLRECDIGITFEEIVHLDPLIVELANQFRPGGKTAWVASTALGEAIIKLLYREHNWSAEWRTFSTLNAAVAWCMHGRSA